jgi:hypothetical protein
LRHLGLALAVNATQGKLVYQAAPGLGQPLAAITQAQKALADFFELAAAYTQLP